MIHLPNNCRCSEPSVFPKDWKNCSIESLKKTWRIQYYFYDDNLNQKKLIVIKSGINHFKKLQERRKAVKALLENELNMLENEGYNPIKKAFTEFKSDHFELSPNTGVINALKFSMNKIECEKQTKRDLKWVVNNIGSGMNDLKMTLAINEINRRHIKLILNHLELSNNSYNVHLKYLSILFKELVEIEAMDSNFIRDISKKKTTTKIRTVLNMDQRKKINKHLKQNHYEFWRFTMIFFHSGGRVNELLNVKKCDVDLKNQSYKAIVKKGKEIREVIRVIKDMSFHLWEEALKNAADDQYIFSVGLKPGTTKINSEQISRRWKIHVKDKLNVSADFYSLKHLNLDETTELLSLKDAAVMASHTSTKMIENVYAVGEKARQLERLKKLGNDFA